ncbi:MAG: nitroreductase [Muribaculaceae bacterium]|nr:nitroreductase [Muribaculaceae bacterium]
MTLQEAILARHSVRAYKGQPLTDADARALQDKIEQLNREGQLHIQLIRNEPKAFLGPFARYGKFRGVTDYLVMAGVKADDLDDRIGYYGEQLVLFAQTIGLSTCWVGLSYTKIPGTYVLNDGEVIQAYIAIGYGATQGVTHKIKRIDQVSNVSDDSPEWFRRGVEAALLAPTAINQQKFSFELLPTEDGQLPRVLAKRHFSLVGYTQMDLGIAKYHFELGAGKDNFVWA